MARKFAVSSSKGGVGKTLQANGHTVGFLGDVINDAPGLCHIRIAN